ncbi:hypothetical protein D5086_024333 [Populus alba]|uniref:Uncharacterized protein n=1 Tax=Populus alba TaxID=43335 RepID=A0ACC4B5H0_POPAL
MPSFNHQHTHQSGSASGLDLYNKPSFKNWYKDEKYSTRVKDSEGCPAFALVNKATGQAMKHSIGEAHPVRNSLRS